MRSGNLRQTHGSNELSRVESEGKDPSGEVDGCFQWRSIGYVTDAQKAIFTEHDDVPKGAAIPLRDALIDGFVEVVREAKCACSRLPVTMN
jgi:hypothetical protein